MRIDFRDEDFILRGIGIDNGTTQIGFSVHEYDLKTGMDTVVYTEAYNPGNDSPERYPTIHEKMGAAEARIARTRDWLWDRLEEFRPHVVGCESPFFMFKQPMAYTKLLLAMNSMMATCLEYDPCMDFVKVPPGTGKKQILHSGMVYNNDKEQIRQAILTHPSIRTTNLIDLRLVSADESDSVAIGYCVVSASNTLQR